MVVINNVEYKSFYELCQAYDISYAEFIKFRTNNKNISELELLGHFIDNIAFSMKDGTYVTLTEKSNND